MLRHELPSRGLAIQDSATASPSLTVSKKAEDFWTGAYPTKLRNPCLMQSPLATIIVVNPRERRAKCTVHPLRGQPGFLFYKHPRHPQNLERYVRLGLGGELISQADADCGLLVLDGTWRWVEPMERLAAAIPVRSLPPLVTAYPRSSKVSENPEGGLATIEAIYAAYRLLGRDPVGLFDHYRWADQFIEQNAAFWRNSDRVP